MRLCHHAARPVLPPVFDSGGPYRLAACYVIDLFLELQSMCISLLEAYQLYSFVKACEREKRLDEERRSSQEKWVCFIPVRGTSKRVGTFPGSFSRVVCPVILRLNYDIILMTFFQPKDSLLLRAYSTTAQLRQLQDNG